MTRLQSHRPVRDRAGDRPRRHGRGVPRQRHADRRAGRAEAGARRHRREAQEILEAEQRGAELQKQFSPISSHVPQVYEYGSDGGYFYVAMEYLDGENLSDVIARGPLPVERARGHRHRAVPVPRRRARASSRDRRRRPLRSLLHGDLKPRNIRITSAGQVKVLDFGIAKALSLSRKVTRNDFGSVAYLSPERLETRRRRSARRLLGGRRDALRDAHAARSRSGARHAAARAADSSRASAAAARRALSRRLCRRSSRKLLGPTPAERYASARDDPRGPRALSRRDSRRTPKQEGWPRVAHDEPATRRTRPRRAPRKPVDAADDEGRTVQPPPIPAAVRPPMPPPLPVEGGRCRRAGAGASAPRSVKGIVRALAAVIVVLGMIAQRDRACRRPRSRVASTVPTAELDELGRAVERVRRAGAAQQPRLRRRASSRAR